jgi:hypothetical protein
MIVFLKRSSIFPWTSPDFGPFGTECGTYKLTYFRCYKGVRNNPLTTALCAKGPKVVTCPRELELTQVILSMLNPYHVLNEKIKE